MLNKVTLKELERFTNGVKISESDKFTIEDLVIIANNMKNIDPDYYDHCFLGIIHDETNGDPVLMEYLLDKAIADGIIPK